MLNVLISCDKETGFAAAALTSTAARCGAKPMMPWSVWSRFTLGRVSGGRDFMVSGRFRGVCGVAVERLDFALRSSPGALLCLTSVLFGFWPECPSFKPEPCEFENGLR